MSIILKNKIAITYIPNGKEIFKPLYCATIVSLDKVTADTNRQVVNTITTEADTTRHIKNIKDTTVDLKRNIKNIVNVNADLLRKISNVQSISVDTSRRVQVYNITFSPRYAATLFPPDKLLSDIARIVVKNEDVLSDTLRRLKQTILSDTARAVSNIQSVEADTLREVGGISIISADTNRQTRAFFTADLKRRIVKSEVTKTDTIIRTPARLIYRLETPTRLFKAAKKFATEAPVSLYSTLNAFGVTSINLSLNEMSLSDQFDMELTEPLFINCAMQGQLFNYKFDFLVENLQKRNGIYSVKGMYNQDAQLYTSIYIERYALAQTLTNEDINVLLENVPSARLIWNGVSESGKWCVGSTEDGRLIMNYIEVDGQRLSQFETRKYLLANYAFSANYIKMIANALGLKTYIKIQDFKNTQLENYIDNYTTYLDILTSAYSWSSKLPHRQINVFIRDDTLYVLQRGLEDDVYDITDIAHSEPEMEQSLMRTTWKQQIIKWSTKKDAIDDGDDDDSGGGEGGGESGGEEEEPEDQDQDPDDDDDDDPTPFTGDIEYEKEFDGGSINMSISYSEGLMQRNYKRITTTDSDIKEETTTVSDTKYSYSSYRKVSGAKVKTKTSTVQMIDGDKMIEKKIPYQAVDPIYSTIHYLTIENTSVTTQTGNYKDIHNTVKENFYEGIGDAKYIFEEREIDTVENWYNSKQKGGWYILDSEKTIRQTFHAPVGNGWYATTFFENGEFKGGSLSQGKPFQQVTPYVAEEIQKDWNKEPQPENDPPKQPESLPEDGKDPNNLGGYAGEGGGNGGDDDKNPNYTYASIPEVDSSFPTNDPIVARVLEDELKNLNRKIQETVSVTIYGEVNNGIPEADHIVDFTERVKLDGVEYFLVSNEVEITPRLISQTLNLVRWF